MLSYKEKYLKYKEKYINFKNTGGTLVEAENCMRDDYYIDDIIQQLDIYKKIISYIIQEIKLKQVITLDDFMYLEEILNYVYNIKSFIEYYKKTLLLSIKQSPIINSKHNELYNLLSDKFNEKKKYTIDSFIKNNIVNILNIIFNLINDKDLLKLLQLLLKQQTDKINSSKLEYAELKKLKGLNILYDEQKQQQYFYEQQIIDLLTHYINKINSNLNNIIKKNIEDETYTFINNLWINNQDKSTDLETKKLNYKNIFLKMFDTAEKLKYDNILIYHQNKEGMQIQNYDVIANIIRDNLREFQNKRLLMEQEMELLNGGKTIDTIDEYKTYHKLFIEKKYGSINETINNNINIYNLIEGLRWIVYKYYNLLMIKSTTCKGYREDITVYDFYDEKNKLVGVVYFDINYNGSNSTPYIYEFRTRYNYNNIDKKIIKVVPIICLYIDFNSKLTLSDIKSKLFHEFGHAIHTILSQNHYQKLSPNLMRSDYVEIMSQFFELYIFEKEFIKKFLIKELIVVKDIPDYDNFPQITQDDKLLHNLYEAINFEEYFYDSEDKFLQNINYLLISLLEIRLKVLSKQELEKLDIINYSDNFLQELKQIYNLPNYVSYKKNVLEFERIYKYPLYYVYIISFLMVNQIKTTFGATLFDKAKTAIYINDILSKGNITDISTEINMLILKLKSI